MASMTYLFQIHVSFLSLVYFSDRIFLFDLFMLFVSFFHFKQHMHVLIVALFNYMVLSHLFFLSLIIEGCP